MCVCVCLRASSFFVVKGFESVIEIVISDFYDDQYVYEETFSGFRCNDGYDGLDTCRDNSTNSNSTSNLEVCEIQKSMLWCDAVASVSPYLFGFLHHLVKAG